MDEATKKFISKIIDEAVKNDVICDGCTNNKSSKSKITLAYDAPVARASGNPSLKTVELEFGFCENHKKCDSLGWCTDEAEYLFQCGHRLCKTHYDVEKELQLKSSYFCENCKTWICGGYWKEGFDTHIWCHARFDGKGHYVCFSGKDSENPSKKKNSIYHDKTWVCPACKNKKKIKNK